MDFPSSLFNSILTAAIVVAGVRTDIQWLKTVAKDHAHRINNLETRNYGKIP